MLIAEDMYMLRKALVSLLELEPGIEVVAEVGDGTQIMPTARQTRPNIAVVDINLPGLDGLSAASALHKADIGCRTIILTSLGQPDHLRRAIAANVHGFMLKDSDPGQLSDAIRSVASGKRVIDPEAALAAIDARPHRLTERELQVLRLAADGEEARQVAARLSLSTGTVRNYLSTAVSKLGGRNLVDALRIMRESGWL
ncbi:DNA-binding response regulator [Micromonospora sp. NPDC048830]|uniref:response regulator transcription factor n=1 Tax=Micromonospora sp. NPDC048830 TaxID=3364257 RepID=UPI003721064B